ncbi:MAG: sugar ABC transporter permease [Spirochaetaceae bacterium]|jgi:ABC-type sugar transport system permease subunit|nr:sugar ABC transporter permease [Spirochaetaceae bacterium]
MAEKKTTPYLFVLPAVLLIIGFLLFPVITGFAMAFQRTSFAGVTRFVGFDNYIQLIREGGRFFTNIRISLTYVISNILLVIPMSYATALLITRKNRLARFFRSVYLLPWIIAPVVSTLMVRTMLNSDIGLIQIIIKAITHRENLLLTKGGTALLVMILHSFWRSFPYIMLFLAAGISTISDELYEAARVDGAGKLRCFFALTVPMTLNQLGISVLMVTIWTLQDSESVYALTQGGPGYATENIAVRVFKASFVNFDLNMGAALSIILVLLSLIFMFLYFKSLMRGDVYE